MSEPGPLLFERNGIPFATGASRYRDSAFGEPAPPSGARIFLEILPGDFPSSVYAMVDTAAPWCIFEPGIGRMIKQGLEVLEEGVRLQTRLGLYRGDIYQGSVRIIESEGAPLDVQALIFLSPDWPGGNFLGYTGFLDRIRFAVDPHRNRFYFSSL